MTQVINRLAGVTDLEAERRTVSHAIVGSAGRRFPGLETPDCLRRTV